MRDKHKLFIEAYTAVGDQTYGNGAKSAKKAGYSQKDTRKIAYALLQRKDIKEAIEDINRQREGLGSMSKEDYLSHLWSARNSCKLESVRRAYDELIARVNGLLRQDADNKDVTIINAFDTLKSRIRQPVDN